MRTIPEKLPIQYRTVELDHRAIGKDGRIPLAISSEKLLQNRSWVMGDNEILSHAPGSIVMDRLRSGVALLYNHDPNQQLGVVEDANVGSHRVLRGMASFLTSDDFAQKKLAAVNEGKLRWVSVGYRVLDVKHEGTDSNGIATWRITKWEPVEVSLVTVPADATVGVGRALSTEEFPVNVSHRNQPTAGQAAQRKGNMESY